MIIENIVCLIVGILIGYVAMYVAGYKLPLIKELRNYDCERRIRSIHEELRHQKHALWMARAKRALMTLEYFTMKCRWFKDCLKIDPPTCDVQMIKKWAWAERKCREKAKDFE